TMELSDASLGAEQPVEAYLDPQRSADPAGSADTDDEAGSPDQPAAEPRPEPPAEPRAKPAKKRGRASVPSWDEIMFGGPSER
ncbi:MAG TPA: septation protein SepH, partial [Nocardioides sp.]